MCMGCMEVTNGAKKCPRCGFTEAAVPQSFYYLPPRTLLQNKYLVGRVLGQGGFAITYLAWDVNLSIKLAIKEYFPADLVYRIPGNNTVVPYSTAQNTIFAHDMEKFLQEARMLARFMEHPNIVSVTDFFQANHTAYLVMHYIEGVTLRHYLRQSGERLPFATVMDIMMPVLDALRVIHEAGLLHRDISPENIIISRKKRVMLIDFGAARGSMERRENSLSVIMKPGYTPEEQYRSKGVQGPWTDIYAAAATIYRAITGQMLPSALDRLEKDTLPPPSHLVKDISPDAERALLKALAVNAAERFKTVDQFQRALMKGQDISPAEQPFRESPAEQAGKKEGGIFRGFKKEAHKQASPAESPGKDYPQKDGLPRNQVVEAPVSPELPKQEAPPGQVAAGAPEERDRYYTNLGNIDIGRASDNLLVLDDETVSRYHARIFSRYGRWYLADLDSTHGTFLNNKPVKDPVELSIPAEIRLGETILHYDGKNIVNNEGVSLHTFQEPASLSERMALAEKLSARRMLDSLLSSLDRISLRGERVAAGQEVKIGRSADNDLVLSSDMVSRNHAKMFFSDGSWHLADLKSTHGTKVNQQAVGEVPVALSPADTIEISNINLKFDGEKIFSENGKPLYTLPGQDEVFSGRTEHSARSDQVNNSLLLSNEMLWLIIGLVGLVGIIILLLVLLL